MLADSNSVLVRNEPVSPYQGRSLSPRLKGRDTALEVLYELGLTRPDVVAELVPELVELALGLDYRSARIRELLTRLDQTVLESRLKPNVRRFVEGDPVRVASEFWGLIELLDKAALVALEHLSWPSERQRRYLTDLGVAPSLDDVGDA